MKITEAIKECRARYVKASVHERIYDTGYDRGQKHAYSSCVDMLETTIHEIQNEPGRFKAEAENEELSKTMRANAKAVTVILEWVLGEDKP